MQANNNQQTNLLTELAEHIPREQWFSFIQDQGIEMTELELITYSDAGRKCKTRNIAHGGFFYKELYKLAELLFAFMDQRRDEHFERLSKLKNQKTPTIHQIGKCVASRRAFFQRSDLHAGTDQGFGDLIQLPAYNNASGLYIVSQAIIVDVLVQRYGTEADNKKITTDDKVRVAGILITDPDMRDFIPALTGTARNGDRQSLDSSRSRKVAGLRYLYEKFVDPKVNVIIPSKWNEPQTRTSINTFLGEGVYEQHGQFNPNNLQRIRLPWTEKDVGAIYAKVDKEYKQAMDRYTQGTGGGPGADENFAAWEQRCETNVVTYTTGSQPSLIYLSVVHMWDKHYDFPFVTVKDTMPIGYCVDDDFGKNDFNDEDGDLCTPPNRSQQPTKTPSSLKMGKGGGIEDVLKTLNATAQEGMSYSRELIDFVKNSTSTSGTLDTQAHKLLPHDLTKHIAETQQLLSEYEVKIEGKRAKRAAIKNGDGSSLHKKKKLKLLKSEIDDIKKMILTLRGTIEHQRNELESATMKTGQGACRANNSSSEDSDDDLSSSSSDNDDVSNVIGKTNA